MTSVARPADGFVAHVMRSIRDYKSILSSNNVRHTDLEMIVDHPSKSWLRATDLRWGHNQIPASVLLGSSTRSVKLERFGVEAADDHDRQLHSQSGNIDGTDVGRAHRESGPVFGWE